MSAPPIRKPAGDVDYGVWGISYSKYRRPEQSIARLIDAKLGSARTVLNVGAGTGSYEPVQTRTVTAVEPDATMRGQRPQTFPQAIDAVAEELPFADGEFDAAMAIFTIHQWKNLEKGLAEVRRVTKGPVVMLTQDPDHMGEYWLADYAPELIARETKRMPPLSRISAGLGAGPVQVIRVRLPRDCTDGFMEAYWTRPEMWFDEGARRACSAWSFIDQAGQQDILEKLKADLDSGEWDRKHGHLREQESYESSLVLVVAGKNGAGK
ncbi:methylase [Gonapodya prolifera JEL478]|uniref:Methylase n=1 Tax=Gonapodya prolifera (strain JEL478) TaxID=1344416 RepID=A0A139A9I9_GONPJ|nr:methylase [Gonapodya prolifera JEL478]|eukprot:KXS13329.1 methylase [Gonapodya prolifera JEL478]